MEDGLVSPVDEGTPQGGPLSPLLSNLVLDELDKELTRRGHLIMRGMLGIAGETDLITAQDKIMVEVQSVSENMFQFIMSLTAAFWTMHFGTEMTGEVCSIIGDAPRAFDVWIPFFTEIPDAMEIRHAPPEP
jgi:hypothetical protein